MLVHGLFRDNILTKRVKFMLLVKFDSYKTKIFFL